MKLRYKLIAIVVFLAGIFMWGRHSKQAATVPVPATVLPKEDNEQIIVDPIHHTLIVVKPTGNQTLFLPDHQAVIDIRKDGTVKVTSPQFGWEHRLFLGVHASDRFRLAAGMDAFYFKKLDVGLGLAGRVGLSAPIGFAQVSYAFYDNCRIGLAYGTNRYIAGTLTIRL